MNCRLIFNKIKDVGDFLRIFPTFVFLFFCLNLRGAEAYRQPDFAFPVQVEEENREILQQALKEEDDIMALRAMMNLCVANNELKDQESLEWNINLIDSVGRLLDDRGKSLAYLIEAIVLLQEYQWDKFVYDQRILPAASIFPEDPKEWSGKMYRSRILELVDSATLDLSSYYQIPLSKFEILLDDYKEDDNFKFSLGDFIILKSAQLLKAFATQNQLTVIPFYPSQGKDTIEGKAAEKAKNLLSSLIEKNFKDSSIISALGVKLYSDFLPEEAIEDYLKKEIEAFRNKEGEALLIFELWNRFPSSKDCDKKEIYNLACNYISNYPSGRGTDMMKYVSSDLIQKRIALEFPQEWLPETPLQVNAVLSNINSGNILVYKLNPSQYDEYGNLKPGRFSGKEKPLQTIALTGEGSLPFEAECKVVLPGLQSGMYLAVASEKKTLSDDWKRQLRDGGYSIVRITGISILTFNNRVEKNSGKVYVTDARNQKPLTGAVVSIYNGSSAKPVKTLVTGKDGSVQIPSGYFRIKAQYGNNVAWKEAGFNSIQERESVSRHVSLLTDLSIYRPGDEVKFAAVGWQQNKDGNSLIENSEIEITLRDANYSSVGSLPILLDREGRGNGSFKIPEGRLLGSYSLTAVFKDQPAISCGSAVFEVADYKIPPFEVTVSQENSNSTDTLYFAGTAKTYAGLPVTDANVDVVINFSRWSPGWVRNNTTASFHTSTVTSSEGTFKLELPAAGLKNNIFERGVYTLKAEVTSAAGELVSSSPLIFYMGKGSSIRPSMPDKIEIKEDSIRLNIPVFDMAGLPEKIKVFYRFSNQDDPEDIITGEFISPSLFLLGEEIKSGRYRLEFGDSEDNLDTVTETVFWRSSDKKAPYPVALWIPENEYTFTQDQKEVEVKFGSYWNDWIFCVISDESQIVYSEWIHPSDSLINLKVDLPDSRSKYFIQLAGLHDLEGKTGMITLVPAKQKEKLKVETISFRENITAGTSEKWKFRFKVDEKDAPGVNVFAVMTDKALNVLRPFQWNLGIWQRQVYSKVGISTVHFIKNSSTAYLTPIKTYPAYRIVIPEWQTYGYPWVSNNRYRFNEPVLYKMAATRSMNDAAEVMTEESVATGSDDESKEAGPENVELRPVELPVAFFMPGLKADADGTVEVEFITPDFNTTWQFQLVGYNEELLNASLLLDAVSAKDVMVKSNLPQYLRTGDRVEISALLFNNSSEALGVAGKIQVINPAEGNILAEKDFEAIETLPSQSRLIALMFDVPDDVDVIAVRSYAFTEEYKDGEQGFIPVYPSSTPVIDSKTFYAGNQDSRLEMRLPKFKKDANVTLKYCDNPIWEVLLSLPVPDEIRNGSVLSIAKSLYVALTGKDIVNNQPEIAEGLNRILNSEDSVLTMGHLQKDEALSYVSLIASPWINNAASETLRIRSLKGYLEEEKMNNEISELKAALERLQNPDGGWSWFEGFNSSPYITARVIEILSYLETTGLADKEIKGMALKGVSFYDRYLENLKKAKQEISLVSTIGYLYARGKFTSSWPGEMKEIRKETLRKAKTEWRYGNLGVKALTALFMLEDPDYIEEGKLIMKSIPEFLNREHPLYDEAMALLLYNQEDPQGETADRLRELIYLRKETEEWGKDPNSAGIIHSLVLSAPVNISQKNSPDIFLDGKRIALPENQKLIGSFTLDLDASGASGKTLEIIREPGIPAWGGVIAQYIAPVKEVKKASVADLKIEKSIFVMDSNGTLKSATNLKKGDKVRIVLNIECGKEMDYVSIVDRRAASLQPLEQLSGLIFNDGILMYREVKDNSSSFFIEKLYPGKHIISYDCTVEREGEYASGITSVQSLYSPSQTAHTAGKVLRIE